VIKQTGDYDCCLACIAMLVGKEIKNIFPDDFREHVEEKKGTHGDDIDLAFNHVGMWKDKDYWTIPVFQGDERIFLSMLKGRKAMIQVPSLNKEKSGHMVFWDGGELKDPSNLNVYNWLYLLKAEYIWIFNQA
jgi:ABC-type bacteriocin/lantibiotic exporter with double-glycine peptidase domain